LGFAIDRARYILIRCKQFFEPRFIGYYSFDLMDVDGGASVSMPAFCCCLIESDVGVATASLSSVIFSTIAGWIGGILIGSIPLSSTGFDRLLDTVPIPLASARDKVGGIVGPSLEACVTRSETNRFEWSKSTTITLTSSCTFLFISTGSCMIHDRFSAGLLRRPIACSDACFKAASIR